MDIFLYIMNKLEVWWGYGALWWCQVLVCHVVLVRV